MSISAIWYHHVSKFDYQLSERASLGRCCTLLPIVNRVEFCSYQLGIKRRARPKASYASRTTEDWDKHRWPRGGVCLATALVSNTDKQPTTPTLGGSSS